MNPNQLAPDISWPTITVAGSDPMPWTHAIREQLHKTEEGREMVLVWTSAPKTPEKPSLWGGIYSMEGERIHGETEVNALLAAQDAFTAQNIPAAMATGGYVAIGSGYRLAGLMRTPNDGSFHTIEIVLDGGSEALAPNPTVSALLARMALHLPEHRPSLLFDPANGGAMADLSASEEALIETINNEQPRLSHAWRLRGAGRPVLLSRHGAWALVHTVAHEGQFLDVLNCIPLAAAAPNA